MQSMTGYGKAEYQGDNLSLTVELKTVNNRFLDIVSKYPRSFICFDDLIRKTISSKVSRGRVELFITLNDKRESERTVDVDLSYAKGYVSAFNQLKNEFSELAPDLTIRSLMLLPDVVKVTADEVDNAIYEEILTSTLTKALDNLNAMRFNEGEKLKADMLERMNTIENFISDIAERAPVISQNYRQRLTEKVSECLENTKIDDSRIVQEVAIFIDKSNIDEELTRLRSHIVQFREIVEAFNAGRKLDFLVQEFNREVNTICSKSNDLTITKLGLLSKCEIEKIREQIQNVE